jgi:hypothetical protein
VSYCKSCGQRLRETRRERSNALFTEWWDAYPVKRGMDAARGEYYRALLRATPGKLLAGARALADHYGENLDYVPNPARWLSEGRWTDSYPPKRSAAWRARAEIDKRESEERARLNEIARSEPPDPGLDEAFDKARRRFTSG